MSKFGRPLIIEIFRSEFKKVLWTSEKSFFPANRTFGGHLSGPFYISLIHYCLLLGTPVWCTVINCCTSTRYRQNDEVLSGVPDKLPCLVRPTVRHSRFCIAWSTVHLHTIQSFVYSRTAGILSHSSRKAAPWSVREQQEGMSIISCNSEKSTIKTFLISTTSESFHFLLFSNALEHYLTSADFFSTLASISVNV